jgi:AmiR/NasT family two-component response regulator
MTAPQGAGQTPEDPQHAEIRRRAAAARQRSAELHGALDASLERSRAADEQQLEREINSTGLQVQVEMLAEQLAQARERIRNLEIALETNRHIAMAVGILMARRSLKPDEAFAAMRAVSQRRHVKLREVADEVVYTGELPVG